MREDMDSLLQNQTWDLVQFLVGKREFLDKWIYRLKEKNGGKKRYKAILVVKGFSH
jgi:hypothetical protein